MSPFFLVKDKDQDEKANLAIKWELTPRHPSKFPILVNTSRLPERALLTAHVCALSKCAITAARPAQKRQKA